VAHRLPTVPTGHVSCRPPTPPLLHVSHPRRRVLPFLSFLPLAPWTGPHFSLYFGTRKPSSLVHGRRPGIEPHRRPRIPPLPFLHLTIRNLPPGATDLEPPPSQPPSSVSTVSDPFLANWFCPSPPPLLSGAAGAFHRRHRPLEHAAVGEMPPSPFEPTTPPVSCRLGEILLLPPCLALLPCSPPSQTSHLTRPHRSCRRWAPRRPDRAERGDHAGAHPPPPRVGWHGPARKKSAIGPDVA
jgi:hypothetical protein